MTLRSGASLGAFTIVGKLGEGGMGEVWRATDTRLGRQVALKLLPEDFAIDPERQARFEREAKVLASLNHPNIATLYGLEHLGDRHALVMELVEGEDLAQRLSRGAIPVDEAIAIALQVAGALEAAHERGIVHRDLKPANVKVTPEGTVKVLDFGLAKAWEAEGVASDPSLSPTITAHHTREGVVLGTAAYMSPEQARGKRVDRRADIWAFGCLVYEMLTGRSAFAGETASDTLAAILTADPDLAALPAGTPAWLRELLTRCLRRDARQRLRDIGDARLALEEGEARGSSSSAGAPGVLPSARRALSLAWGVAGVCAVAAAILAVVMVRSRAAPALAGPEVATLARITPPTGRAEGPTWSPDGSLLAFASDRTGDFEIYVRRSDGGQDIDITNDPGQDIQPAFSPDGTAIAFVSTRASRTGLIKIGGRISRSTRTYGGDLWVAPSLGGAARRLAPDANAPAWRPDGRAVLFVSGPESRRSIMEVALEGGAPRAILGSDASSWEIESIGCSPDGRWISLETSTDSICVLPAGGGTPREVLQGFSHRWDGSSRRLWALVRDSGGGTRIVSCELDPGRGELVGSPATVGLVTANLRDLAVSRDGRRLAVAEDQASRNLTRLPLSPRGDAPAGPEEPLSAGPVIDGYPAVSPDNRRITYMSDILGHTDVWVLDLATMRRQRLQFPGDDLGQEAPSWMPDGRQVVALRYLREGYAAAWIAAVDGSRQEELIRAASVGVTTLRPSPDGRSLLLSTLVRGVQQVCRFDLASRAMTTLTDSPADTFDAEWSPDGRWIVFTATAEGGLQLFRMPAEGGKAQQLTTGYERMRHPFFSPDGKWVYVQPSHRNIFRLPAEGGALEQVTRFPEAALFIEEPSISRDGRYLVYCRESGGSTLWQMTLADRGSPR